MHWLLKGLLGTVAILVATYVLMDLRYPGEQPEAVDAELSRMLGQIGVFGAIFSFMVAFFRRKG